MGTMTPAMKHSMIKSALRKMSMYWKPIQEAKKTAKVWRKEVIVGVMYHSPTKTMPYRELDTVMMNFYKCNHCKEEVPEKTFTLKPKTLSTISWPLITNELKLKNNLDVDHINPVVTIWKDINWHEVIEKLLDENPDNYQLLCKPCHKNITREENKLRK